MERAARNGWIGSAAALAAVAVATGLIYPLKEVAPAVSLGVVYIPGVLAVAVVWGTPLGLLTAVLSALAFNVFHLPPLGTLDIGADRDLAGLVVFVIVAIAGGVIAGLMRERTAEAERGRAEADRALAELEELSRERERLAAAEIEAEALRRSDDLKTALLRAVSHDLRTPLTSIIAAGTALDSPSVTAEERRELSAAVVEQGERLSHLVENLLDVGRLQSGGAEPHREPVDLEGLLEAARRSIGDGGDAVRLALDDDLPPLSADAAQLERAFANLLDNAVVHGEGEQVLVRSRLVGPRLVVRVVDRGPGIPAGEVARVFDPFYRGAGAVGTGSGLGLSIARGLIEANGGEVAVESLPGQGTSFVVSFEAPVGESAPTAAGEPA